MRSSSLASFVTLGVVFTLGSAAIPACGSSSSSPTDGFDASASSSSGGGSGSASSSGGSSGGGSSGGSSGGFGPVDSSTPDTCTGLQCQIHGCATGSTTISGKVYDPAGKNPLYNVVVYVPNSTPAPLTTGASCDSCGSLYTGDPVATALTDATGSFTIQNAPDGANIPLVVQVGKWRKQLTVPSVAACADTALPDKSVTLPKNHTEGDIPQIAISTGGADSLECLLKRVGLDDAEYGGGASTPGHIHIFKGHKSSDRAAADTSPASTASNKTLWDSKADLMKYDMVLLSCEGQETTFGNEASDQQALHDYASAGGRVFASHYHYAFFNTGPYASENLAEWVPQTSINGSIDGTITTTLPSGQPFAKGQALHDWLANVNALTNDELPITDARHDANVTAANTPSQSWIQSDANSGAKCKTGHTCATMYFSFNTPTDAPMGDAGEPLYCGRVVYSDLHVGAASGDYPGSSLVVPTDCAAGDLSAQEKALEFMLFDLSSCVSPDDKPPPPPPPTVK